MQTATPSKSQSKMQEVSAQIEGIDVKTISALRLPEGELRVSNCQLVHFSVGNAQSPIQAQILVPALKYQDQSGRFWTTPLKQIYGYSND
jgi:hypothetical protein